MSLTESERSRLPGGLPYGATDRRDLPNVPEGSLLPAYTKPIIPTGVPVEGRPINPLSVLSMDEVIENFDADQLLETEVDYPDDLGVGGAGA